MPFTDEEIQSLLAVKGIGKTILQRLQQIDLDEVLDLGPKLTGSTCWKNSPQARVAMQAAVVWVQQRQTTEN